MNCPMCLTEFTPDGNRHKYCTPNCSRLAQLANVKRYQAKLKAKNNEGIVCIVHDPLSVEDGGFSSNTSFDYLEFQYMLKTGSCTNGMIVKHCEQQMRVVGQPGYEQTMEAI